VTKFFEINVKLDKIFHLACMASPKFYQKDPIKTLNTCYIGTKYILEKAIEHKSRVLFTSTSEVYGDPLVNVQSESYLGNVNCIGPRACYDEGKRIAETLCSLYKKLYNVNVCIARIFNTYGEYMSPEDGRVISNIITQCLNEEEITIYGDGKQTRSFCYISDQIRGLKLLIDSEETGPINIGNTEEITILTLAEKIKNLTGSKSNIKFLDLPADDPAMRKPDISLAKERLLWQPEISLEEGLLRSINFNRKNKIEF
jgi:UDP-glucuronate decarboxylase